MPPRQNQDCSSPRAKSKRDADRRVTVYNVKTGKKLSGNAAPKHKNLRSYLKKHPDFNVFITKSQKRPEVPVVVTHVQPEPAPQPQPQPKPVVHASPPPLQHQPQPAHVHRIPASPPQVPLQPAAPPPHAQPSPQAPPAPERQDRCLFSFRDLSAPIGELELEAVLEWELGFSFLDW